MRLRPYYKGKNILYNDYSYLVWETKNHSASSATNWFTVKNDNYGYFTQYKKANAIVCDGSFVPDNNECKLGDPSYGKYWLDVYTVNAPTGLSDRNKKRNIDTLNDCYDQIFNYLKPVQYKFKDNQSNRTHTGFIAQDVKEAVELCGLTTQDFAAYCEWTNNQGETTCGLRYTEFIALCVDQIQKLKQRNQLLEEKFLLLEEEVERLKNKE